jgi:thioredoxin reductase (NADPH)
MFDLVIIGGGPAGLTAAIYGQRYGLKTLLLTDKVGGLLNDTPVVENYPGFKKVGGPELGQRMKDQAEGLGAEMRLDRVVKVSRGKGKFTVETEGGKEETRTVVLAPGLERRQLEAKGADKFKGKGISFCATCDSAFFKDKPVAVVGGGNSAAVSALTLAQHASKVYVIYRRDKFFRMQPAYVKKLEKDGKVEPVFGENVVECMGGDSLERVKLESGRELEVNGLFVEIGFVPELSFDLGFDLELDEKGFIKVDAGMRTSVEGVFAAGDVTTGSDYFWQIVTAAAEGALASKSAHEFLNA